MKTAKTTRILTPIEDWQQLPNGKILHKQTQLRVNQHLPLCFGYHLLKLGKLSCQLDTSHSKIRHQINCAGSGKKIDLLANIQQLPLQDSSIDLCILAHELDFSSDPHQLLREVERVLTLDGTLIISGYNPISIFGLRSILKSKDSKTARLFLLNRILDWLHLLGFEIQHKQHFDFMSCEFNSLFSSYVEKIGQRYAPYFCSAYVIVAKKHSSPITPIKSPFQFKKQRLTGQGVVARQHYPS
jgi:SAM-dependent methyltransferase